MTSKKKGAAQDSAARLEISLQLVELWEAQVGAFTAMDPARVRAKPARGGALAGMALGVKDIVETSDYPTCYGSPIYEGFRPVANAACVALLEREGAVVMGKTVTTEFAFFRPGKTKNPFDMKRTPGGSSSGSAVAVACGMVELALASQTAASLTRPASYCGIAGFKPSYGTYSLEGVKGLAPSFDTLGMMAPDVARLAVAHEVLGGGQSWPTTRPARMGFCRTPWWHEGDADMHEALEAAARLLGAQTEVEMVALDDFAEGEALHKAIMSREAAQALTWEYDSKKDQLSPEIVALIEAGMGITRSTYLAAQACAEALRRKAAELFQRYDVLLAPAAPGEAPLAVEGTGNPIFSRLWTLLRLPSLTLPGMTGANGLPIGIQLLGALGCDEKLLGIGAWVEERLPPRPQPELLVG